MKKVILISKTLNAFLTRCKTLNASHFLDEKSKDRKLLPYRIWIRPWTIQFGGDYKGTPKCSRAQARKILFTNDNLIFTSRLLFTPISFETSRIYAQFFSPKFNPLSRSLLFSSNTKESKLFMSKPTLVIRKGGVIVMGFTIQMRLAS